MEDASNGGGARYCMAGVDSRELQPSTPEVELPGVSSPSSCGVVESGLWELRRATGPKDGYTRERAHASVVCVWSTADGTTSLLFCSTPMPLHQPATGVVSGVRGVRVAVEEMVDRGRCV